MGTKTLKRANRTPQEIFWEGDFGSDYAARNDGEALRAAKVRLFARILGRTRGIKSVIEFGANIGLNLAVIRTLLPGVNMSAVEINAKAAARLKRDTGARVRVGSLLDHRSPVKHDFVLSQGLLIHLDPGTLPRAYDVLHRASRRYICLAEYYSRSPAELSYRGHTGRLFKRDFAGEMLDAYHGLSLVDYGFVYHRDPVLPLDDVSWFLLEKNG